MSFTRPFSRFPMRQISRRGFFTVIQHYQAGSVFKFGRYAGSKEPGLRISIPIMNAVRKVDMRTRTMQIPSQELITIDNITLHIDAVAFFKVTDALKSLSNVDDPLVAVGEAAQTSLRDQLSRASFAEVLNNREEAGKSVLDALCAVTAEWGILVEAIKLKNIKIDISMIRAMARQAEAERLKTARLIEATAEFEASKKLVQAAREFEKAPMGLRLRELQTYSQVAAEKNMVMIIDGKVKYEVARGLEHLGRMAKVKSVGKTAKEEAEVSDSPPTISKEEAEKYTIVLDKQNPLLMATTRLRKIKQKIDEHRKHLEDLDEHVADQLAHGEDLEDEEQLQALKEKIEKHRESLDELDEHVADQIAQCKD